VDECNHQYQRLLYENLDEKKKEGREFKGVLRDFMGLNTEVSGRKGKNRPTAGDLNRIHWE